MAISTIRHDEVFAAHKHNEHITLIGAGAIGSRVWSALVELGLTNLTAIDFDEVEPHNLANQLYGVHDVGKQKIAALADWTNNKIGYLPESMSFVNQEVTPTSDLALKGTVILAVDSIEAREMIVKRVTENENDRVFHIFDTRMASTHGDIFYFSPNNPIAVQKYLAALPSDEEAEVSSCGTSLTVGTTASIIANIAVWQLMHQRANPDAMDKSINLFFKPLCMSTS